MRGETYDTFAMVKSLEKYFNPLTPCGVRPDTKEAIWPGIPNFNPLTPCGVRHVPVILQLSFILFQSTHPMRGETAFMPQISSAHKCICTKPAHEFLRFLHSVSKNPPDRSPDCAKIRCEPSRESVITSPSRNYDLKPCSRLRFILIIHQQFPPWQVPEAHPP